MEKSGVFPVNVIEFTIWHVVEILYSNLYFETEII